MSSGNRAEDALRQIADGVIDTVIVAFPDLQGRLMGKRLTGHQFLQCREAGVEFNEYLLTMDVENDPLPGFPFSSTTAMLPDVHASFDLSTLRVIPWLEATALVLCDLESPPGTAVEIAPRTILRRQVERAAEAGFTPKLGSELEFYLFRDSFEEAAAKGYRGVVPFSRYIEDYHILQGTRAEWFLRQVRNGMDAVDVPVESSKGEWGPGQQEINLEYGEALLTADRHVIYKHGVKEMAALGGVAVTFMAKWSTDWPGSSFHVHSSLWGRASGEPLFHDAGAEPYQMSRLFRHYLAGLLATAREFSVLYAPYVNSYRRYRARGFAPGSHVWGYDNRSCGFRVVGRGPTSLRLECRVPGADANPYLVSAGMIAAGLYGIHAELELPVEFVGDAYSAADLPRPPRNLYEAVEAFEQSVVAREAFGNDVVDHYAHAARMELDKSERVVTDWDLARQFELI